MQYQPGHGGDAAGAVGKFAIELRLSQSKQKEQYRWGDNTRAKDRRWREGIPPEWLVMFRNVDIHFLPATEQAKMPICHKNKKNPCSSKSYATSTMSSGKRQGADRQAV